MPCMKDLRRTAELHGIEPASKELLENIEKRRNISWATEGSDSLKLLEYFNAEASVNADALGRPGMSIILKPNPSKAAVLEEFLHGTQHKLGFPLKFGTEWSEVHVKSYMIRHSSILGIAQDDVNILKTLLKRDINDLNQVIKQQPEKQFKKIIIPVLDK